jgi:Cu-Zn family superoxide dismutase
MRIWPLQLLLCATVVSVAGLILGACTINEPVMGAIAPSTGNQALARLVSKNGSITYGTVMFTQRGEKVAVLAQVFNLPGGPHSLYIHETGNCSSPNAASAGPVWNAKGATPGARRSGELPNIVVRHEEQATLEAQVTGRRSLPGRRTTSSGIQSSFMASSIPIPNPNSA